ncbi:MAG: hypothetical protein ABF968_07200 [Acetobacter sp.]|uniref:hypothetical protein n=1 Tax=Acetobacter sp. TaxID=440 RepID=UPI0039EAA86D
MMGDPGFYVISLVLFGLAIGFAAAMVVVMVGDFCSAAQVRRGQRIDAALVASGTMRRRVSDRKAGDAC